MPLLVNLRHLEREPVHLQGELPVEELALEGVDELIHPDGALRYDFNVQKMEKSILAQGRLSLPLRCDCARCLKTFAHPLNWSDWTLLLALEGEDSVPVANDCVDLTPYIREDILLELPQHPLCKPDCGGLPKKTAGKTKKNGGARQGESVSPTWAPLNKLKF